MPLLLLSIAAVLVGGTAYLAVSLAPPRTRVGRWLALWIAVWVEVVLIAEALSLLEAVTPFGFLAAYVLLAAIVLGVWIRRGRPRTRLLTLPTWGQVGRAFRTHPALSALLVVLGLCALANLALALALPANNWDSMTYHLSRVGYWIQNGSTDHFLTHNPRQNYAPPNAEFGMLSTIIFARAEWPAALGQYAAYLVCLAAVYFAARETGASNAASLFAALLLGTMTELILQASTPKNDLIVASFLACAVGFALVGLRAPRPGPEAAAHNKAKPSKKRKKKHKKPPPPQAAAAPETDTRFRALVWSALALGLAVGTKVTALLFLPGLAVAGAVLIVSGGTKDRLRRGAIWAGSCACAVLMLGAFNFIRNVRNPEYRSAAGPKKTARLVRLEHWTPGALVSNLARYGYHLCDFSGLGPQQVAGKLNGARATAAPAIFRTLGIAVNAPALNYLADADAFVVDEATGRFEATPSLHEDTAWFGPIAFFVAAPLVLVHLVWSPLQRRWGRLAVAAAPVLYWLTVCSVLRYQPWGGRFYITAAVTGAPLLALAYGPTRARWVHASVRWVLVAVGVSTALTATLCNELKPVFSPTEKSIFAMPRLLLRCKYSAESYTLLSIPPEHLPERMTLGLVLSGDDWDWPLFGPRLQRTLVPLPRDAERIAQALDEGAVHMVVISKKVSLKELPPLLGERPVVAPIEIDTDVLRATLWSFVFPSTFYENVLFPARDWTTASIGSGGEVVLMIDADQQFVPARVLPRGRILFQVEPNPDLVAQGPLFFDVDAGTMKIYEIRLTDAGPRTFAVPWASHANAEDQILRVRVTSPDSAVAKKLQEGAPAYRLPRLPLFEPGP